MATSGLRRNKPRPADGLEQDDGRSRSGQINRVMPALLKMKKLDIKALWQAYESLDGTN
jgi:hypothetical protein